MKKRLPRKQFSRNIVILLIIFIIIAVGYYLITNITKKIAPPSTELDRVLEPIPDKLTVTTAKLLKGIPNYKKGVNVKQEIKSYIDSFTVRKYEETAPKIIGFQDKINGLDIENTLAIDTDLAGSLETAAENVRINKENISKEQQSCGIFNGLLNPSLLVMDLTLWTGKSRIYPTLQQYQDVGVQCLFYYPQVSHGMFTYDVKTGRIVQRSVFCDPSETKSKCFGVWDYFWKFAADPVEGPINYGVGCSLTDWMNQGFVCVNGVDLRTSFEGKIISTVFEYGVEGQFLGIGSTDVKDEFRNALGASGKTIIDNVKQKCAKVKDKTNKYASLVPTLTGAGSSLTGGVISTATAISSTGEGLQEEYEKAMLFASLFSEACTANPGDLAKDLAGGGGAGQFGLNKPNACILSETQQIAAGSAGEARQCVSNFAHQQAGARMNEIVNYNGLPDNQCRPSAATGPCTSTYCLTGIGKKCGDDGKDCGREPSSREAKWLGTKKNEEGDYERKSGLNVRIADDKEINDICGKGYAHECYDKKSDTVYITESDVKPPGKPTTMPSPNKDGKYYTAEGIMKHAEGHRQNDDPSKSEKENERAQEERDKKDSKNFVKLNDKKSMPTPDDGGEPGDCSGQAEKMLKQWEGLTNCFEKTGKVPRGATDSPVNKPLPDPPPPGDEVGGTTVPKCDETAGKGGAGGYFGTKENSADDCIIGDFCDFGGSVLGGRMGTPKICQQVESAGEEKKPPCPGLG